MILELMVVGGGCLIVSYIGKRFAEPDLPKTIYPVLGQTITKKGDCIRLSCCEDEQITILSAKYGEYDVTTFLSQCMDSDTWDLTCRVCDRMLIADGDSETEDDIDLVVNWKIERKSLS
jgi:hypothetical protein